MEKYFSIRFINGISLFFVLFLSLCVDSKARQIIDSSSFQNSTEISFSGSQFSSTQNDTVPLPRKVMIQSLILPGWGQYTNRQAWKIPIIYGLIGGISYYSYWSHTQYQGYRAAFYNSFPENTDFRFGQTPSWIDPNASPQFLRENRNFHRNRRDFLFIAIGLAYLLNVVDAYVYAHMRDFDVSDDLGSLHINDEPLLTGEPIIKLTYRIRF